jgi:hypothetical protein
MQGVVVRQLTQAIRRPNLDVAAGLKNQNMTDKWVLVHKIQITISAPF